MDVSLRPLTADDFEIFCGLMDGLHGYHVEGVPYVFRMPSGHVLTQDQFNESVAAPDQLLVGAFDGDKPAGFVWAFVRDRHESPTHLPRKMLIIEMVEVAEAYRRQGIGEQLVAEAQRFGREHGSTESLIEVWSFNQSGIAFYQKLGYETELLRLRLPLEK